MRSWNSEFTSGRNFRNEKYVGSAASTKLVDKTEVKERYL